MADGYDALLMLQFGGEVLGSIPPRESFRRLGFFVLGILELTLERPEVKNAISWELMTRLRGAIHKIEADATAKVVLVASSVPGVFCAGADLKERRHMSSSQVKEYANSLRSTFSYFEALSIPTIAVIEGAALGGENATLGLPETGLAIIPGCYLNDEPRVPISFSSGMKNGTCNYDENWLHAFNCRLANYRVPAGEAYGKALELAREMTKKGPLGVRMAKKAIDRGMEVADMRSALAVEGECYEQLLHTQDRLEGLAAFAEKRKPVYTGAPAGGAHGVVSGWSRPQRPMSHATATADESVEFGRLLTGVLLTCHESNVYPSATVADAASALSSARHQSPTLARLSTMRSLGGLRAVSGHLAAASGASSSPHCVLFARALQILAQPEPVRLHKLSAPDSGPSLTTASCSFFLELLEFVFSTLKVWLASGIVELRLERPEARNAIGKEMLKGLRSAMDKVGADPTANVVLERRLMGPSEVREFVNTLRATFSSFEALPIPTIAVVEGAAFGGGLELALSCDLRICGESATFSLPETGLAIIPGAGGTQRLPRIVGRARAKELIFTGRRFDATEAVNMGVVNYCVPGGEAYQKALELAREINQKGPLAIRMAKKAINEGMEVDLSSALAVEEGCYEQVLHTQDRLEGLAAFAEKRKPLFTGK
ncbi:Methylglutaconyl-CoA hydratase, mitochondrial [Triticum urartu]|uniref:Methylglutaconyl-CoA hydratase, mitochondrial n=1 Tax=Triticum urartu TaxID=4572 RepID=M7ZK39_TRIUA|nr:Methylglutaconyl-CoA hydratase, mitochondrial [Triticum urartu]